MRNVLIAGIALLILAGIFLQQNLGISPADALATIQQWPLERQLAIFLIGAVLLVLLVIAIWQSDRVEQQSRAIAALQKRMNGLRDAASDLEQKQGGTDAAVRHLVGTDPTATVEDVQQRLAQAEARTAEQQAQNEAIDLQSRIEEIRRRQQALRTTLGMVSEKRRAIEPMLGEVKDRQVMIERSLSDLEKDDAGRTLHSRLEEAETFLNQGDTRVVALEGMFSNLKQLRERGEKLQVDISPLRDADTGIKAVYRAVETLRNQVDAALGALEKDDNETLSQRVERLTNGKLELERRIVALTELFASLENLRGDIGGQFQRMSVTLDSHVKR